MLPAPPSRSLDSSTEGGHRGLHIPDNNTVERAIRPVCLSRKNALFTSGDDGGARWAAIASLIETYKLNAIDPQRYLADLLIRLDELMPWQRAADAR